MAATNDYEPYENTFSIEDARREMRRCWDLQTALIKALRDLPEVPPYDVQIYLDQAAKWPEDNSRGKEIQSRLGSSAVWYKSECEGGAGVWSLMRSGILAARTPTPSPAGSDDA